MLADVPGWTAQSFEAWYHLWNMRDEDVAKLMDGVTKSGVLEAEAKPGQLPLVALATVEYECPLGVIGGHKSVKEERPLHPQEWKCVCFQ